MASRLRRSLALAIATQSQPSREPAAHTATRLGRDAHPKWVMFVSRLRKYGGDHDHITPAAGGRNHLRKRSTGSGRTRSTRRSRAASDSAAPEGGQVWK